MFFLCDYPLNWFAARDDDWQTDPLQATLISVLSCQCAFSSPDNHRHPAHCHPDSYILCYYLLHVRTAKKRRSILHILPFHVCQFLSCSSFKVSDGLMCSYVTFLTMAAFFRLVSSSLRASCSKQLTEPFLQDWYYLQGLRYCCAVGCFYCNAHGLVCWLHDTSLRYEAMAVSFEDYIDLSYILILLELNIAFGFGICKWIWYCVNVGLSSTLRAVTQSITDLRR